MGVLVIGNAGYIGDSVVENLLLSNYSVCGIDRLMYTDSYMRPNIEFIRADIRDKEFEYLMLNKWDAVIHLAAIVGDGACQANPQETVSVNEDFVAKLVGLLSKETRLIFASTCSVYGANNDLLDENSNVNPLSLYAGTKLKAEDYVRKHSNHVIFRLGTLFGLSSPFARIRSDLVANTLAFKACEGNKLTVFGGEQWRPLVHVKDVGRIFAEAVEKKYVGTFILSYDNYKIIDIAKVIDRLVGDSGGLEVTDMKFEDLRNYRVNNNKAKREGILPDISLYEGIDEIVEVYKRQGRIKNPWLTQYNNAKFIKELT
jgi:nucleoside-diphosphate-sugar epimerase